MWHYWNSQQSGMDLFNDWRYERGSKLRIYGPNAAMTRDLQNDEGVQAKREHWGVENGLHWVLDVAFREDDSRIRIGHADANMAVLRHMAVNLLKQETTSQRGINSKRLRCGWDETYLMKVLKAGFH